MQINEQTVQTILTLYPQVQAVCLFGSYATADERRKILAAFAKSGRAYDV